jgi:FlaA1/EpsC-like NDP-sugar epimerase
MNRIEIQRILADIGAGDRVVVYGAGEHTCQLIRQTDILAKNIVGIVDKDAGQFENSSFWGFPVNHPAMIGAIAPNVIVVSSFSFQNQIVNELKNTLMYQ